MSKKEYGSITELNRSYLYSNPTDYGSKGLSRSIIPPDLVTLQPTLFTVIKPHALPTYMNSLATKKPFLYDDCYTYDCVPYQKDDCCKFK